MNVLIAALTELIQIAQCANNVILIAKNVKMVILMGVRVVIVGLNWLVLHLVNVVALYVKMGVLILFTVTNVSLIIINN